IGFPHSFLYPFVATRLHVDVHDRLASIHGGPGPSRIARRSLADEILDNIKGSAAVQLLRCLSRYYSAPRWKRVEEQIWYCPRNFLWKRLSPIARITSRR